MMRAARSTSNTGSGKGTRRSSERRGNWSSFITGVKAWGRMNSDFKDLLSILNAHNVRYLVVGGYAVMKYTEPRYTKDLDVWVDASPENARAVFESLRQFGAPLTNLSASDFAHEGCIYQMGRPPARVDVLTSIEGVRFADAWRNRVATDFDGAPTHLISRHDLLVNKRALGRPQDLLDANNLVESQRALETPQREPKPKKGRPKGQERGTER
jgi:hypothetical protein